MAYTSSQVVQAVPTGINSALVLISSGTATGAATLSFTNVFSSTYDTYKIIFRKYASVNNNEMYMQLGTSGTADTGGNYVWSGLTQQSVVTNSDTVTSQTSWAWASNTGAANNWAEFIISNPNLAQYTQMYSNNLGNYSARLYNNLRWHQLRTTTQYTDFFITSSVNPGDCEYAIYGYVKS